MVLAAAGGIGRKWCCDRLGRFFTVKIVVYEEHILVTDGLYATVRHPAYLMLTIWAVGTTTCLWADGSWPRECGVLQTWLGYGIIGGWTSIVLSCVILAFFRAPVEDEMLSKKMREQWVAYAKRTPYRIIPFVY
ncbi:hypothetical protein CERSUDRAFT_132320 [Gelatoporia subvermispora B]|uniref:Protein-S-isoprenylcysteine O-methyltransferase n=1 Tax=Ceriporiopsis subvermispora (strain B) TaxID=914234 RepID=M2QRR2_CERS8|nr:hypothetical protein CERSUDRAFT_132320 [Gelatoporia subvermispora B]